jgi:2-polyprenyl-6-methoxyphenol hydroxylase-like FAD-dependent oxidoreductase
LLENVLYQRLAARAKVQFLQGFEVTGLNVNRHRQHVTGVRLRDRQSRHTAVTTVPADLVVDASGRGSQAPRWLDRLSTCKKTTSTFDGV